jgi:DNA-binding transcriptional MerR regulator
MSVIQIPAPRKTSEPAPRFVTIKTILQKTGIHRQTVHYYLRKELLPLPQRTSRTSALYPSSTIDLIQLIQVLQRHQRLSLDEIVVLFKRHNYDLRAIRQAASESSLSPLRAWLGEPQTAMIPISEAAERIDPPPPREWVEKLLSAGVLRCTVAADGRKAISVEGMDALRAVWEGVRSGASVEQFTALSQSVEKQAQHEFDQFLKNLHALSTSREAGAQVARVFSSLERFGALRRKDALHALFIERLKQPGNLFLGPNRTYVFPSRTFLQRMGLFREVDLLLRQLDRNPNDLHALRNLARACYVSSDWSRLHGAAQEILRLIPDDANATALYGQALLYLGRSTEAIAFLEDAVTRGANAMAKVRLGQAIAMHAYESADAARLLDAVIRRTRLANEAIRESAVNASLHRKVRLNTLLDTIYFSDPLGLNRPVEKEALALYEEFKAMPEKKLPLLARISLAMAKMYSTYALYLVREQQGDKKAGLLLKEIAKVDPDCILAGRQRSPVPAPIRSEKSQSRAPSQRASRRQPAGAARARKRG